MAGDALQQVQQVLGDKLMTQTLLSLLSSSTTSEAGALLSVNPVTPAPQPAGRVSGAGMDQHASRQAAVGGGGEGLSGSVSAGATSAAAHATSAGQAISPSMLVRLLRRCVPASSATAYDVWAAHVSRMQEDSEQVG
jgi:hypothetical protein